MAIAILFIITQNQKQPKCLTTGEWISKFWYIHKMQYDLLHQQYTTYKMDKSQKHCAEQNKPISQEYLLFEFIYMKFCKR